MGNEYTREALYDLVWSVPKKQLAEQLGVSDVAIGKACKKAGIPVPDRGYWAKKQSGKRVVQPPLPPRFPGASNVVEIGMMSRYYGRHNDLLRNPLPPPPSFTEDVDALRERITKLVGKVALPRVDHQAHPITKKLLANEEERVRDVARGWSWNPPRYATPIGKRKLRILNALLLATQRLGCKPYVSTSRYEHDDSSGSLHIGNQTVRFSLKAVPAPLGKAANKSTKEILRLEIEGAADDDHIASRWDDGGDSRLEEALTTAIINMFLLAELSYRRHALEHHAYLIKYKAELEERERQRLIEEKQAAQELRKRQEQERVERLLTQADALHQAETIRRYVAAVQSHPNIARLPQEQLSTWFNWALEQADRIDPVKTKAFLSSMDQ